ncbi:MAG: enoyl-CoA hydratase/isomerase family protein [Thermodesulfobacteriota bacterium]
MAPAFEKVLVGIQEGVATVTINNPQQKNALDHDLHAELQQAFGYLRDEEEAKVVVLTGAGDNFCTGGNLVKMQAIANSVVGRQRMKWTQRLVEGISGLEKPVIAMIRGIALGAGMSLALAADVSIAAEDARLMCSFSKIGLVPDWGQFYLLPSRVGLARAKWLMLTGAELSGAEAVRLGLIALAVPGQRLEQEAYGLARSLAQGPCQAYAMIKAALNCWPSNFQAMLEMEAAMQGIAFCSQDHAAARQAFIDSKKHGTKRA